MKTKSFSNFTESNEIVDFHFECILHPRHNEYLKNKNQKVMSIRSSSIMSKTKLIRINADWNENRFSVEMQNFCWSCYISHCRICQCCISHHFSREFMDHNHRERIKFDDRRFEIRVQFVLQFTLATAFLNILFSSISPPKQKSHLFAFPPKINSYIYAYSFCFSTLEL